MIVPVLDTQRARTYHTEIAPTISTIVNGHHARRGRFAEDLEAPVDCCGVTVLLVLVLVLVPVVDCWGSIMASDVFAPGAPPTGLVTVNVRLYT
jgi:hypothetical protein